MSKTDTIVFLGGSDYGKYVAPTGTDPSSLSLAPGTNTSLYKKHHQNVWLELMHFVR